MKTRSLLLMIAVLFIQTAHAQYGFGLKVDPNEKIEFREKPNSMGYGENLPTSYSLKAYTPYAKSQGQYGTCAAWSAAYAGYTTQYAKQMGITNRNTITALAFCPYFVYNSANGDANCGAGTSLTSVILYMVDNGVKKFYMPVIGCGSAISEEMKTDAERYRITDAFILYNVLDEYPDGELNETNLTNYFRTKTKPDYTLIKESIAAGSPVIYGGFVPNTFMNAVNKSYWEPTTEDLLNPGKAVMDNHGRDQQHGLCIVGYDDNKYGGAFEIMNSWSELWGDNGFIWVRYDDWALFNYQAFALDIGIKSKETLLPAGCVSGDCAEGYGIYKFDSGERYEGHYKNGLRNGYGIYTWPNGEAYAGEWFDGKRHGEATVYQVNGNLGTCTYKEDKQTAGYGDWTYNNGDRYTGNLSENYIRNGYGVYSFTDGRIYSGANNEDAFEGLGKMTWSNGDEYIGEWSDNSMHGYGIYIYANGTVKAGKWSYGVLSSGQSYGFASGDDVGNLRSIGSLEAQNYATADCITGDCLNGKGSKKYNSTGTMYNGEFKDALEDGYGTMTFEDGATQSGYFKQGMPNGVFKTNFSDASFEIVDYVEGQIDEYILSCDASGNVTVFYFDEGVYIRQVFPSTLNAAMQPVPEKFGTNPTTSSKVRH